MIKDTYGQRTRAAAEQSGTSPAPTTTTSTTTATTTFPSTSTSQATHDAGGGSNTQGNQPSSPSAPFTRKSRPSAEAPASILAPALKYANYPGNWTNVGLQFSSQGEHGDSRHPETFGTVGTLFTLRKWRHEKLGSLETRKPVVLRELGEIRP